MRFYCRILWLGCSQILCNLLPYPMAAISFGLGAQILSIFNDRILWFRRTWLEKLLIFLCVFNSTPKHRLRSHGSAQPFGLQGHSHSGFLQHVPAQILCICTAVSCGSGAQILCIFTAVSCGLDAQIL
jgi:hypothetical protein